MDTGIVVATRRSLHAVAEQLLAGPQHRAHGTIRLGITPGGFGQVRGPWRVEGTDLVGGGMRVPLRGDINAIAATAGIEPGVPAGLYADHADLGPGAELAVDAAAAALIAGWFARGDAALRTLAPDAVPVLWPEHFDLGVTVDEVNYGISPGDATEPVPYAYVGPWKPRQGEFWNAPFGAARTAHLLPDAEAVAAFLVAGRDAAAVDPLR